MSSELKPRQRHQSGFWHLKEAVAKTWQKHTEQQNVILEMDSSFVILAKER
jgi:phosphopantetheinyl transferase (holo-ACP synthase)